MKVFFFLILIASISCKTEKKIDSVFDVTYRNHKELSFFKDFEKQRGCVINDELGISTLKNGNDNYIILNKFINKTKVLKYKILDTLNVGDFDKNQYLAIYNCLINNKSDKRIIALLDDDYDINNQFITNIIKSWVIDIKRNKIVINKNIKAIKCENESFGL